jgi:dethiobiotin synthetase
MARKTFFIAGTDTDVGKTLVAAGLLVAAKNHGLTTAALKPLAAGCEKTESGLRNADALLLQSVITQPLMYEQINPIALESAIAPHIAAQQEKRILSADRIAGFCRGSLNQADFTLVEGAGGWRVPLNPQETLADVAKILRLPVILVVGVRLGCINHALLTVEAICQLYRCGYAGFTGKYSQLGSAHTCTLFGCGALVGKCSARICCWCT